MFVPLRLENTTVYCKLPRGASIEDLDGDITLELQTSLGAISLLESCGSTLKDQLRRVLGDQQLLERCRIEAPWVKTPGTENLFAPLEGDAEGDRRWEILAGREDVEILKKLLKTSERFARAALDRRAAAIGFTPAGTIEYGPRGLVRRLVAYDGATYEWDFNEKRFRYWHPDGVFSFRPSSLFSHSLNCLCRCAQVTN